MQEGVITDHTDYRLFGKYHSQDIIEECRQHVTKIRQLGLAPPKIAFILVGDRMDSRLYVSIKKKTCQKIGIQYKEYLLEDDQDHLDVEITDIIKKCNVDSSIHGVMVQLPLPSYLDEDQIVNCIRPDKDIDGLHPINLGNLFHQPNILPCTPWGIVELLQRENVKIRGATVTVVGCGHVGKPLVMILLSMEATISCCNSSTPTSKLQQLVQDSDIVIVAVGKRNVVQPDWITSGSILIDVGIHSLPTICGGVNVASGKPRRKICGDVDHTGLQQRQVRYTPTPGGVGPMTVAMLMKNVIKCYTQTRGYTK